jgi:subtilase family serine protease
MDNTAPSTANSGQSVTVEWVVTNQGTGPTNSLGWTDRVYLSLDGIFDGNDLLLGSVPNGSYLNPGDSYRSTHTANLPQGIQSNYRLIVVADAANNVAELNAENDNSSVSSVMVVNLTPPPDLVVSSVLTALSQVFAGQQINVTWTVANQGTGPTIVSNWTDQVFVSFNGSELDGSDTFLIAVPRTGALLPGENYTVSNVPVSLPPGVSSNTAFIIVRTDSGNQVFEHVFENNNTAFRSQGIAAVPPPDLAVSSITAPSSIAAGQVLDVAYTVTNEGASATFTGNWTDAIYLSPTANLDTATAILLGNRSRSGVLTAGQSETNSYSFTLSNTLSGDYYVVISTDINNQVNESDDNNNIVASSSKTRVNFAPPDLTVTSISASPTALSGKELAVTFTVNNQGFSATNAASWFDGIYLSTDRVLDASDLLLTQSPRTGVLTVGQSQTRSINVQLPIDRFGAYFVIVAADNTNSLFELDEADNTAFTSLLIQNNQPDLSIRYFTPRISTGSVNAGATISLDYSIENRGNGNADSSIWSDRVILSKDSILGNSDDIPLATYASPASLEKGSSYSTISENIQIPNNTETGTFRLFLQTDFNNSIAELNENNNQSVFAPINITAQPAAATSDLTVTAVAIPATANSGGTITVDWSVINNGLGRTNASSWTDRVWLKKLDTIGAPEIPLGSFTRSAALDPGQSYTRSESFNLDIDLTGFYTVTVQTDFGNTVFEGSAENNNQRTSSSFISIALSPTADLRVVSVNPPLTTNAGRPMTLTWTVQNFGGGSATGTWSDSVYLSLDQVFDPVTDISIGYLDRTTALASGSQYTATSSFNLPVALGGRYYVFVVTDSTNRVYERNAELNNNGYAPQSISVVFLPPADLVVGEITIPTNGTPGQNATITFTVNNNGQNPATGSWSDAVYISADSTWDINDALFGRVTHSGDVAAAGKYTSSLTAALPGVLPGNYKVIVRSDIRNNLVESNETNNLSASLDSFAVDFPELVLGSSISATLINGGSAYYRLALPANENVTISLTAATTDSSYALYVMQGTVPTSVTHDLSSALPFELTQRVGVEQSIAGDYYLLVQRRGGPADAQPFTLRAEIPSFVIYNTSFGIAGTEGRRTLAVTGGAFDGTLSASLISSTGVAVKSAVATQVQSSTEAYVSFDLRTVTPGMYSVLFTRAGVQAILVSDSLRVIAGGGSEISFSQTGRLAVRPNELNTVALTVTNRGSNDLSIPLLTISNDQIAFSIGTWADRAILNKWLQVTVLATANTGLSTDDQFYFGNAVGETGNSVVDAAVTAADILGTRGRIKPTIAVPIDNKWDFDRNGFVTTADMQLAQQNTTAGNSALVLLAIPANVPQNSSAAPPDVTPTGFFVPIGSTSNPASISPVQNITPNNPVQAAAQDLNDSLVAGIVSANPVVGSNSTTQLPTSQSSPAVHALKSVFSDPMVLRADRRLDLGFIGPVLANSSPAVALRSSYAQLDSDQAKYVVDTDTDSLDLLVALHIAKDKKMLMGPLR